MPRKVGIVAGAGPLPRRLIDQCLSTDRPVFVLAFTAVTDAPTVDGVEHAWVRLGAGSAIQSSLETAQVDDVCLVGKFHRPSLRELMPDWRATRFLLRVGWRSLGDSGLLDAIRTEVETLGYRIIGPQDVAPSLLAQAGCLTEANPDDLAREDMAKGFAVARALGHADVGQAVIVQQGVVLTVEAAEGTDAMIERSRALRRDGPGGVLIKAKKPQQDDRLDLPTVGVRTVNRAAEAGLRGIAVEAAGALIVDADAVAAAADRAGLFVVAEPPP